MFKKKNKMSCKSCKSKKIMNEAGRIQKNLLNASRTMEEQVYDKTLGQVSPGERFTVIVFGFIPMIIGYISVIKFIISLL
tara:strand:- start:5319 stop:5558 length:240 start_codon:yes stop_codon:yes gene_type:complete